MIEEQNIFFSVKKNFKHRIEEIWNNEKFNEIKIKERGYAIQDDIHTNSLMFIGINPSFNGDENSFFYNNNQIESQIHPYFRKFQQISEILDIPWTHFDLLFVRETQQNEIEKIFSLQNGVEFIFQQLQISKEVIELARPKIIVVNNSLARKYFGLEKDIIKNENLWMNFNFDFDPKIGTYLISDGILKNTPVFFTSMLTGQRALDKGSYERLIWHIDFVLKNFC